MSNGDSFDELLEQVWAAREPDPDNAFRGLVYGLIVTLVVIAATVSLGVLLAVWGQS